MAHAPKIIKYCLTRGEGFVLRNGTDQTAANSFGSESQNMWKVTILTGGTERNHDRFQSGKIMYTQHLEVEIFTSRRDG
jgi:hypothetical protein